MKKILKFLLLPVFVSVSTLTVVACSNANEQVSNQDIITSAVGRMQDHIFDMTYLGLSEIPSEGTKYDSLAITARNKITNYYSKLVETGLTWDYPTVTVQITANDNSNFFQYYGPDVESKITLFAELTFKGLTANKDIVVKINNDTKNEQDKINAVGKFLEEHLEQTDLVVPFKTLFKDGLRSDENNINGQIEASLRNYLFFPTKENPVPIIDVDDIQIYIYNPNVPSVIYNLNNSAIDAEKKIVSGTLQNLTLRVQYQQSTFHYDIEIKSLKIAQTFSDIENQLSHILNQSPQSLQFIVDSLPNKNQIPTLSEYDKDDKLSKALKEKLFSIISKIYPTEKMIGEDSWDAQRISIDNASSSPYVWEDESHGYFLINVHFSFKVKTVVVDGINKTINLESPLVSDLKLNLKISE